MLTGLLTKHPEAEPEGRVVVASKRRRNLLTYLMVMGPGLIVMVADNDAGAVSTYCQAGSQFGTHLLWVLALLLPVTYFVQEMVARLGIVTGQGHAQMIYQRFGKSWGLFSLVDLLFVNFLTLVTEFAAISLAFSHMGVPPIIAVPTSALALLALVMTGSYLRWERVALGLCALNVLWFVIVAMIGPDWSTAARQLTAPSLPKEGMSTSLVFLVIAIIGTTIAPWQLFFQQSCVSDKRLRFSDLKFTRIDTFIGACFAIGMAVTMMLVGSAAKNKGLIFSSETFDPAHMATFLGTKMGAFVKNGLLLLMVNAAILGAATISLSSAWAYGEVKGWPHSLHKKVKEAPGFYAMYALCITAAASIVLIPHAPLQLIILGVQVLSGLVLSSAVVFLQLLVNDRELLKGYVNKPWNNVVNWVIIVVLISLNFILAAQVVAPNLFTAR